MKGTQGRARAECGFTLVETSIAMLVLLVAGLAASSLFVYAIKYNTGANDRAVAQAIAQGQMEVLRKTTFSDIAASTQTVTACGGNTSVKRLTVTVTPLSAGSALKINAVSLITLRSDSTTGNYF
jgi:prepilin-type N-terminal cleavage/methylation domain-containing protein